MPLRGVLTAIAVPAIVLGVIGLVVVETEDGFLGGASNGTVQAVAAQPDPAATVPDAAAAPAPAAPAEAASAVAPAKAAPKAVKAAPAAVGLKEYGTFQSGIINTVDSWWVSALRRAGVSYSGPHVTIAAPGKHASSQCGQAVANPADVKKAYPAFYCRGDQTIYLSSGWLYGAIFARYHRGGVAAIIAHEFGHHVQHDIGIADPLVSRQELQADCLAGVWMRSAVADGAYNAKDVADGRRALRALGDTKVSSKLHHGTPAERTSWFDRGYSSGDAYDCNH